MITTYLAAGAPDIAATIKSWFDAIGPLGKYVGALVIFLIGSIVAKTLGKTVTKVTSGLDSKLSKYVGDSETSVSGLIGLLVRYVLLLFVIIFALDFAGLSQVTQPLNDLFGKFMGYIPNLVGAGIVGYLFFFLANVIKTILTNVLEAAKIDERLGFASGNAPVAKGLSTAAFALILLMGITAALNILKIDAISAPVQGIVDSVFAAIPNILVAVVVLGIGIFVASLVRDLITNLLSGIGADSYPERIGLNMPTEGSRSVSAMAGLLVFVSIVVIMAAAALEALKIEMLSGIAGKIVPGYFNVLLALLIIGVGLLAARYAYNALSGKSPLLAKIAKIAIIVVSAIAALNRSGIAPDITGAPYQAALTGLALALGLGGGIAFGLGGKDAVHQWLAKKNF